MPPAGVQSSNLNTGWSPNEMQFTNKPLSKTYFSAEGNFIFSMGKAVGAWLRSNIGGMGLKNK
jgi:hypothetical protein